MVVYDRATFEGGNSYDDDDDDKITGREKKRSGAQGDPGQNSVAAVAQLCLLCRPP